MTRKDYTLIASVLRKQFDDTRQRDSILSKRPDRNARYAVLYEVTEALIEELALENVNFDRTKFRIAAKGRNY